MSIYMNYCIKRIHSRNYDCENWETTLVTGDKTRAVATTKLVFFKPKATVKIKIELNISQT